MKRAVQFLAIVLSLCFTLASHARLPAQSCRKAWASLIAKNLHKYQFPADEVRTARGNEGYATWLKRTRRADCYKDWTVLVYMAADNDLSPYALADLYEMEAAFAGGTFAGSTLKTDLVVEVDTADTDGARRLHLFQSPRPYRTDLSLTEIRTWQASEVRSPMVAVVPEDQGSPTDRFRAFLEWGIKNYPAQHYAVVVWGHGQGWTAVEPKLVDTSVNPDLWAPILKELELTEPKGGPSPVTSPVAELEAVRGFNGKYGGLAFDDSSGTYLDIPSLRRVLKDTVDKNLDGQPFDVYVSDACLMQQLEVAFELEGTARFVVGSAQIQNFFGLPYRRIMYELNRGSFAGFRSQLYGKSRELERQVKSSLKCQKHGLKSLECQRELETLAVDEGLLLSYAIPELVRASVSTGGMQWRLDPKAKETLTMAAISISELHNYLVPELRAFARELLELLAERPERARESQFVIGKTPSFAGGMKDLGLWLHLMQRMFQMEQMRGGELSYRAQNIWRRFDELDRALNYTVLNRTMGDNYTFKDRSRASFVGASVWLPASTEDFESRREDFQKSRFFSSEIPGTEASAWGKMLQLIYHPVSPGR